MGGPEAALLLTFVVHVIGSVVLIWALIAGQDDDSDWRGWWRGDDGDDPEPPHVDPPSGAGLPLRDAEPSAARLRGPGRIADSYERPARRPAREPARRPVRRP